MDEADYDQHACRNVLGVLVNAAVFHGVLLLADDPQIKGTSGIKRKCKLMKGHMFSFLFCSLALCPDDPFVLVTFYIALLWVMPYMQASMTAFYMDVTGEMEKERRKHTQEMTRWTPEVLGLTGENGNSEEMQESEEHRTGDDYDAEA